MKKIFAAISIFALALCLSSCGNDSEQQTTTTTAATTTAEITTEATTTAEITTEATTTEAEGTGLILEEAPENDDLEWGDFEVVE